ncbi:MAG TPA: hypothetical protein VEH04_16630 [Verrucomicrobiae bacterium]|nr:hypothetical protein [Verrucomicrobiae bacterium]
MNSTSFASIMVLAAFLSFVLAPRVSLNAAEIHADTAVQPDDRDRQVLQAALLHVLADPKFNLTRSTNANAVFLNVRNPDKTGMLRPGQMAQDIGEGRTIPSFIQTNLLSRNQKPGSTYDSVPVSFAELKFDPKIVVADISSESKKWPFAKAHPSARGWFEAWLPGYSEDGKQAVVRSWVGPSPHGAMATIFLEKEQGGWVVKWHHIAHFA